MKWIINLGIERIYYSLIIIIFLCGGILIFIPITSSISTLVILFICFVFGLPGLVCIYFKEMPGLWKSIKGAHAIISGYTLLISSILAIIIIIYNIMI